MMPDPILRQGDTGSAVRTLQLRLNRAGAKLVVDHIFGAKTDAAVRAFQRAHHLVADGIAGPITQATLQGRSAPSTLSDVNIAAAAASLQCDPAAILAVMQVETDGTGYQADGRPRILFERHLMYRGLKAAGIDPAPYEKLWPDIVNPAPGGYLGGNAEYGRLAKAKSIDIDCAIKATSWGLFQILGTHAQALGYAFPSDFVDAIKESLAEQLRIFCKFVELDPGMHKALRDHDWPAFARAYNGPGYAKNHYDQRLALAWAQQGGTAPLSVPTPPPPVDVGSSDPAVPAPHRKRKPSKSKQATT